MRAPECVLGPAPSSDVGLTSSPGGRRGGPCLQYLPASLLTRWASDELQWLRDTLRTSQGACFLPASLPFRLQTSKKQQTDPSWLHLPHGAKVKIKTVYQAQARGSGHTLKAPGDGCSSGLSPWGPGCAIPGGESRRSTTSPSEASPAQPVLQDSCCCQYCPSSQLNLGASLRFPSSSKWPLAEGALARNLFFFLMVCEIAVLQSTCLAVCSGREHSLWQTHTLLHIGR